MLIGSMRDRVAFHRLNATADIYGNPTSGYEESPFLTVWASLREGRGRESVESGRLEVATTAVVTVRSSVDTRAIGLDDQARIDGQKYQIRSIVNPDRRGRFLEMVVERGAAQG